MGLIGLFITVLLMILGAGYFFLSTPGAPITVRNESLKAPIVQEVTQAQAALGVARDVKNLVEQAAGETMPSAGVSAVADSQTDKASETEAADEPFSIVDRLMKSGFSVPQKARTIDTLVLHSSYDLNGVDPYLVSGVIKEYADYGVSAHYLIDRKGTIYRLVADKNIAYHAGVSKMPDNRTNVNDFSLGIEMINTQTGQFTNAQYSAVNDLIASLKQQYPIKSVVGHSDIAPDRKTDPWNFDWKKLK